MAAPPEAGPDANLVLARLSDAIRELTEGSDLEIRLGVAAGAEAPLVVRPAGADGGDDPRTTRAVVALLDAYGYVVEAERTQRRVAQRHERLEREARTDPLTGLLNRRGWDEALVREQARCLRSPRRVAILVVDLDGLKATNDEHGHLVGDALLRLAAGVMQDAVRATDVVARIGGDEFAMLLVDETEEHVDRLAERIEKVLAAECVQASVGGATTTSGTRLDDVFHGADRAMYARKQRRLP